MHKTPGRRSPLAQALASDHLRTAGAVDPGLTITECCGLSILEIAFLAPLTLETQHAFAEVVGTSLPERPGTAVALPREALIRLPRERWLLVGQDEYDTDFLKKRLGPTATVSDVSHGRCILRLSGPQARNTLAKGIPIDLHERAFKPGDCAQTHVGEVSVLVHLLDAAPTFHIYVGRSFAVSFWEWLAASSAQFGYEVKTD